MPFNQLHSLILFKTMPLDVFQFNLTQKCGIIKYAIDKGQTEGLFDQEKE